MREPHSHTDTHQPHSHTPATQTHTSHIITKILQLLGRDLREREGEWGGMEGEWGGMSERKGS